MKLDSSRYNQLYMDLQKVAQKHGLSFTSYGELDYSSLSSGKYATMRIASPQEELNLRAILIIVSGFHGEEQQGPLTLLENFDEIYEYTKEHNVGVIMYPCVNPDGFNHITRYSIEGNLLKHRGNNDFLRYLLSNHHLSCEIPSGQGYFEWYMASDPYILSIAKGSLDNDYYELLQDTILLHKSLKKDFSDFGHRICAFVDLHQDFIIDISDQPFSYVYTFGNIAPYISTAIRSKFLVTPLKNYRINSGQKDDDFYSDEYGFIVRHDGSVEDYMHRMGVPHVFCVETTKGVDPNIVKRVNMLWIQCAIELASKSLCL